MFYRKPALAYRIILACWPIGGNGWYQRLKAGWLAAAAQRESENNLAVFSRLTSASVGWPIYLEKMTISAIIFSAANTGYGGVAAAGENKSSRQSIRLHQRLSA